MSQCWTATNVQREERERCTHGTDSADRGQVGFLPFTDRISRSPHALETAMSQKGYLSYITREKSLVTLL